MSILIDRHPNRGAGSRAIALAALALFLLLSALPAGADGEVRLSIKVKDETGSRCPS